jgi:hypothetical protein
MPRDWHCLRISTESSRSNRLWPRATIICAFNWKPTWLVTTPVAFPRIDWLGVFPSQQYLGAQALILSIAVIAFFVNRRGAIASR